MDKKETFNYTYSAKEQEEIKAIRQKYAPTPKKEDSMTRLRRLDAAATQKATVIALIFGIVGTLIMGFGMSLIMSDFGKIFGTFKEMAMPVGIVVGVIGMVLLVLAYPLYNRTLKRQREKIAPEIIRLTDELMK